MGLLHPLIQRIFNSLHLLLLVANLGLSKPDQLMRNIRNLQLDVGQKLLLIILETVILYLFTEVDFGLPEREVGHKLVTQSVTFVNKKRVADQLFPS